MSLHSNLSIHNQTQKTVTLLWRSILGDCSSVSNGSRLPSFGPGWHWTKGPGPGQDPPSDTRCWTAAVLLPGLDIKGRIFGRVETGPQFHLTVSTTFTPIRYLLSDYSTMWSICEMCSFMCSFICHRPDFNRINIHWVGVKSSRIVVKIAGFAPQLTKYWWDCKSENGKCKHNKNCITHIDHVVILWELKNSIVARIVNSPEAGFGCKPAQMPPSRILVWYNPLPCSEFGPNPNPEPY